MAEERQKIRLYCYEYEMAGDTGEKESVYLYRVYNFKSVVCCRINTKQ